MGVIPQHDSGHHARRVRQSSVVGRGVPWRDDIDGRRGWGHGLVHRGQPAREKAASRARQADVGEASWVGVQLLAFSMSYWFFSVNRATLLWFPLWIMLGRWVAGPGGFSPPAHRLLVAAAFTVEVVLMLWWSWLFFTGHWAS